MIEHIDAVKEAHPEFKCVHGFLNFGEKKVYNPSEEAINYIQKYCQDNNISLMDLFAKLDTVITKVNNYKKKYLWHKL